MGSFYVNITLQGPTQEQVVDYLNRAHRRAYVSPTVNGFTVMYDEECDSQSESAIALLTSQLSEKFGCVALTVLNHDSDILCYWLYRNGELIDEYDSCPSYFDEEGDLKEPPTGGDAERLCAAFNATCAVEQVESILRKPFHSDEGFIFADDRYHQLAEALALPLSFAVGLGYSLYFAPLRFEFVAP